MNCFHRWYCRAGYWRYAIQDQAVRVLRPGTWFVGSDSCTSFAFRLAHVADTMVLVDPDTLASRLEAAGFDKVEVQAANRALRFRARAAA